MKFFTLSKFNCCFVFIIIFVTNNLSASSVKQNKSDSSSVTSQFENKIFKLLHKTTFQIKTSLSLNNSDKSSYGSGFVVDAKQGLLITNYHVVSDIVQADDENYKLYVIDNNIPYQAEILNVDVLKDLALIKVAKKFDIQLNFRSTPLLKGEDVFAFGLPKDLIPSLVPGVFNGDVINGPYHKLMMSAAINAGMSGGPVIDKSGEVVGVNVSTFAGANDISFSVPSIYAKKLFDNYQDQSKTKINFSKDNFWQFHKGIESQLVSAQEEIYKILTENDHMFTLGHWTIPDGSNYFRCWSKKNENSLKKEKVRVNITTRVCNSESTTYLNVAPGFEGTHFFSSQAYFIENLSLNRFQLDTLINSKLKKSYEWKDTNLGDDEAPFRTPIECKSDLVSINKDLRAHVETCATAYLRYPAIIETRLKIMVVDNFSKNGLFLFYYLDGFNSKNARSFIRYVLESIKLR